MPDTRRGSAANDPNARAGLWVHVIRDNGESGFIDDTSGRSARSADWQAVAVNGRVDADATSIMIGLILNGSGRAWIDGISFTVTSADAPVSGWFAPSSMPMNLDFRDALGTSSSGWQVYPGNLPDGYTAEVRRSDCHIAPQCGALVAPEPPKRANATGNLMQRFDATPYRGTTVKVTAWLRAESSDRAAYSFLWLRVDDRVRVTTEENPVRPGDWQLRELSAGIDPDARVIQLCVASFAAHVTWIDGVTFESDPSGVAAPAPVSLEFEENAPGKPPLGWMPIAGKSPEPYSVHTTRSGCPTGPICVAIAAPSKPTFLNLMRIIQAVSRTGHQFKLRAWLKLDSSSSDSAAKMFIRMDGPDGKTRSYAIADSPAADSGWTLRELTGKVDDDAASIALGFQFHGAGTMSVDGVSLEFYDYRLRVKPRLGREESRAKS